MNLVGGHCQVGSLTGAVASKRVTEALKGSFSTDGNRAMSVNAKASLTARLTGRAVTKVGVSDPAVCEWKCRRSTDKSYPGDNRLNSPKRPQRRGGLAPRCRLVTSWAVFGPKGSAVRRLKWYASWVQNVARQFGPYLSWAQDI